MQVQTEEEQPSRLALAENALRQKEEKNQLCFQLRICCWVWQPWQPSQVRLLRHLSTRRRRVQHLETGVKGVRLVSVAYAEGFGKPHPDSVR